MNINISPELERRFRAALLFDSNQSPDNVVALLIQKYITDVLTKEIKTATPDLSNSNTSQTILKHSSSNYKAIDRINRVAQNPHQINHQILKAFFIVEDNGIASKTKMEKYFLENKTNPSWNSWTFENNFAQMLCDDGNSHGHYFDCCNDVVKLFPKVENDIRKYQSYFK